MNYSNTMIHIITFTITLMLNLSFSTQQETHSSTLIDEKMKRIALLKKNLLEIEKFSQIIKTSEKDCLLSKEILSRREYITTYDIFSNDLTINFCLYVFLFLAVVSYVIYVFNTKFPIDYMNKQGEDLNNEDNKMNIKPFQKSKCKMNMSQTYLFNENTILNFENENEHDNEKDLKNKLQIGNYIIEKSNNEETYEEINDFRYILDSL